jgi:hypothetical protein
VIVLDIEVPLNEAIDLVQSLRLIGNGLIADYDDAGRPIVTVALAASDRLDAVKAAWDRIFEAGRRGARPRRRA